MVAENNRYHCRDRLVIAIGFGIYFYLQNLNRGGAAAGNSSSSTNVGNEVTFPALQVLSDTPTSALLTLGTANGSVQVNNFYLSDPMVTDGGETIILASTTSYLITYDTTDSSFWIGIDPGQFTAVRPVAEQALLSLLGVSSTDAWQALISLLARSDSSTSFNSQSFPPSFCSGFNAAR